MKKEKYIRILEAAGFTHKEAEKEFDYSPGMRTEIWEDLEELATAFETTVDAIRAGEAEDLKTVTVDGVEYGIQTIH